MTKASRITVFQTDYYSEQCFDPKQNTETVHCNCTGYVYATCMLTASSLNWHVAYFFMK